jgi:membrane associated rhomboid family serine protease
MKQKRYWLRGVGISLIVPIVFFINGIVKTGLQDIGFGVFLTIEIAIVAAIIGAIIGWIYGKKKPRGTAR